MGLYTFAHTLTRSLATPSLPPSSPPPPPLPFHPIHQIHPSNPSTKSIHQTLPPCCNNVLQLHGHTLPPHPLPMGSPRLGHRHLSRLCKMVLQAPKQPRHRYPRFSDASPLFEHLDHHHWNLDLADAGVVGTHHGRGCSHALAGSNTPSPIYDSVDNGGG
jgi:hypothetical protein